MKKFLAPTFAAITLCVQLAAQQPDVDYSHIDASITPYYNSVGPAIKVGRFSSGLASTNETEFVATITNMKKDWAQLSFPEIYVAAIRLYDLGYRKESVYWFYTAQYRGRQFGMLLDESKMGGIGDPGFELFQAQNAFYQLAGPYINGYAFGDIDALIKTVEKVQQEGQQIPDLHAIYSNVAFKNKSKWKAANTDLTNGMNGLVSSMKEKKDDIKRQRVEQGVEAKFSNLTNKELTVK